MNRDDVDRLLSSDAVIEPDTDFTETVMAAVRRDAERPPLAFPWRRFGIGLAGIAAAAAAAAMTNAPAPLLTAGDPLSLRAPAVDPLFLSAAALLLAWACYATGARLARAQD